MTDASAVRSMPDLAAALDELRQVRGMSYTDLSRAAKPDTLGTSTISEMLREHKITREKLSLFLRACAVPREHTAEWIDAWLRASVKRPLTQSRAFFQNLVVEHTRLFAGRDAESEAILESIRDHGSGYVFLEALSGYGKTSLLAHLVADHPEFCYHFISQAYRRSGGGFDPTRPSDLLESLCEQLSPEHVPGSGLKGLEREFLNLLSKSSRGQTVVVLDGIDELEPPDQLRGLLPLSLPAGLVVILSARSQGDRSHLTDVGLTASQMSLHLQLQGLNENALKELLRMAGSTAGSLADDDSFVTDLHEVSKGDPFYLRFLVEDVEAGLLDRGNVDRIPTGLEGYLDLQLAMLERSAHRPQHVEILSFILEAASLSRADLLNMVNGLTWLNFDGIIREIHRFLLVHDGQYSFCHDRFREYFRSKSGMG
ncbi:NACHT domain-containing protein [Streptomyces chartreusis]|uniref:NACHT domain-containing protein n=1 Tax=Streptomyces chartreusis TaxID=1969 RepID=UPI0033DD840F